MRAFSIVLSSVLLAFHDTVAWWLGHLLRTGMLSWLDAQPCRLRHPGVLKDLILVSITSLQSPATA